VARLVIWSECQPNEERTTFVHNAPERFLKREVSQAQLVRGESGALKIGSYGDIADGPGTLLDRMMNCVKGYFDTGSPEVFMLWKATILGFLRS